GYCKTFAFANFASRLAIRSRCARIALPLSALRLAVGVGTRIAAGGRHRQPCEVMSPALLVTGAGLGVRQAAMGHAQQRSARLVYQIDLDQARPRRHLFAALPAEAVGEAVDRDHLREPAAGDVLAADIDEVEPAG